MASFSNGVQLISVAISGDELVHGNAMTADEMERKKERIMMASLRRRQEAEDAKRRKEVGKHVIG